MNEEETPAPRVVQRPHRKRRLLVAVAIAGALLIAGAVWFFFLREADPQLPPSAKTATFPIYYPTKLPGSFKIETNKLSYDPVSGVLFMSISNVYDQRIAITQQAMPSRLSFDKLRGTGDLIDGIDGKAAVSKIQNRVVANMVGKENQTLILINTTTATKDEVSDVLHSLHPVK